MSPIVELREMIAKELALDVAQVTTESHLQDDLGADSLMLIALGEAIAARFEIDIEGDDLAEVESVGELERLVESKRS